MQNLSLAKWFTGFAVSAALAASAQAALTVSYQFNGNGNWSLDAVGGNGTPVGDLQAFVPTGSTVVKAFLYSSTFSSPFTSVNFDGTLISGASWTALGQTAGLQAYRTDVTAQVAAKIGSGSASQFAFSILAETPTSVIDGQALAIVYSNAAEQTRTIAFLDGFSATGGDSTSINLASPLTAAQLGNANFEAQMSLGIGFGFQGDNFTTATNTQFSLVDVNGQRLTSSAGGSDDGVADNGGLITMGGIGDSTANPVSATSNGVGSRYDDELYNLVPFLTVGQSQIAINTRNPSNDDNIFFAGFNITALAGVNEPPPPPTNRVPDAGSSVGLLGLALAGLAALRRKRA